MRGLAILFMTLAFNPISMVKASDGIPGSHIPTLRSGFSLQSSNTDAFNRTCRSLIGSRFLETINDAAPGDAARISASIQTFIPSSELAIAAQESADSIYARMQHAAIQEIKPKLSPSLRNTVPEEFILLSGFTPNNQDPLNMAGCYIRLGNNLRRYGLTSLAATSFLNSGVAFARTAQLLSQCVEETTNPPLSKDASPSSSQEETAEQINDLRKSRVDMLMSAAQSYYWAYCNEGKADRKATIKILTEQYFSRASAETALLSTEAQLIWVAKIAREQAIFLAHTG